MVETAAYVYGRFNLEIDMKVLAFLAMIFAPSVALAQQKPAHVTDFNGYFLTVSFSFLEAVPDFEPADLKASEVCQSVSKTPELQYREKVTPNRFLLFYLCI